MVTDNFANEQPISRMLSSNRPGQGERTPFTCPLGAVAVRSRTTMSDADLQGARISLVTHPGGGLPVVLSLGARLCNRHGDVVARC